MRKKLGRPKGSTRERPPRRTISIAIPISLADELERRANLRGETVSLIIRETLRAAIHEGKPPDFVATQDTAGYTR